jgi:hypothetical protein
MMLLALMFGACTGEEPAPESCGNPNDTHTFVVSALTFGRTDENGATWGFDLDDRISDSSDWETCYRQDLVSPEGELGIDSAFTVLVPALEATEGAAVEGLIADSIVNGELILLIELAGVDDLIDDGCVDVTIYRGEGTPLIGTDGQILDGQTFAVSDLADPVVGQGSIVDGTMVVKNMEILLPMQILDAELVLTMHKASLRADLNDEGGATGFFGGGVPTHEITDIAYDEDVDSLAEIIEGLVNLSADLEPDDLGICRSLSVTLEYEAIPAWVLTD